jgi:hypothetical protein
MSFYPGRQTLEALDALSPMDSANALPGARVADVTDLWIQFPFYLGRFTKPPLEAALETYIIAASHTLPSTSKETLKEGLVKAVWASATNPSGRRQSIEQDAKLKWRDFYRIMRDLYKRSMDAVSFVVDPQDQIP